MEIAGSALSSCCLQEHQDWQAASEQAALERRAPVATTHKCNAAPQKSQRHAASRQQPDSFSKSVLTVPALQLKVQTRYLAHGLLQLLALLLWPCLSRRLKALAVQQRSHGPPVQTLLCSSQAASEPALLLLSCQAASLRAAWTEARPKLSQLNTAQTHELGRRLLPGMHSLAL